MKHDRIPTRVRSGRIVGTSADAACLFAESMPLGLAREELWVLSIDEDCRAERIARVAIGTEDGLLVEASRVVWVAKVSGCEAFVLGHNHPSGDPRPSLDDWMATKLALEACQEAGLELVDHLILGDGVYVSLRAMNEPMFVEHLPKGLQ